MKSKDPTRKKQMTRLSKLVDPMIEPSARARGFVLSRLISEWQQIVGDMANWCQPVEMKFSKGETSNGSLKLAIASGRGPEASLQTQNIISRVNAAFGYAAISRITLVQNFSQSAPKMAAPPTTKRDPKSDSQNQDVWTLDEKLNKVKSPELRAALRRFGTPIEDK